MSIFDALPNPMDPVNAFYSGLDRGKKDREEREVRGALSAYATNPDDPAAFASLAQYKPELAIKIREEQTKRRKEAQLADLQARATQGDKAALAQLAGVDLDAWSKLDSRQRDMAKQQSETIAQAALAADTPQEWDRQIDYLVEQGIPEAAKYRGRFDLRETVVAQAGQMKSLLDILQPRYQVIPEGGTLVNTNDPGAVQSYVGAQSAPAKIGSKADYDALAPGSSYVAPDGTVRQKPGGGGGNVTGNFRP